MGNDTVLVEKATTNGQAAGNGDSPHNTIQPFTDSLIEAALEGINYTRKPDGSFSLDIPGNTIPAALHCSFLRRQLQIFTIFCEVSPPIPKRKWPEALRLCHVYHVTEPFGRFFLQPSTAQETEATLCFDAHLDAGDGITVAFLNTFIISHLCGACGFLLEPSVQKLLAPARSKKRRQAHTTREVTYT